MESAFLMFFSTKIILFGFILKLGEGKGKYRQIYAVIWLRMNMYVYLCIHTTLAMQRGRKGHKEQSRGNNRECHH